MGVEAGIYRIGIKLSVFVTLMTWRLCIWVLETEQMG